MSMVVRDIIISFVPWIVLLVLDVKMPQKRFPF